MTNALGLALTCPKRNALPLAVSGKGAAFFSALFSLYTVIWANKFLNSMIIDLL